MKYSLPAVQKSGTGQHTVHTAISARAWSIMYTSSYMKISRQFVESIRKALMSVILSILLVSQSLLLLWQLVASNPNGIGITLLRHLFF